jgi:RNase H-fold protein (predicted Holliday junction resolvase)
MATEKTVLAVDPGTSKCGMCVVRRDSDQQLHVIWRAIVPTTGIVPKLHEAYAAEPYQLVIIGDGTNSKDVVRAIREHLTSMGILVIDEKNTTIAARERYWEHHPRKGWRRFWPATLQVPPEPVDDFVALILAERVLQVP